MKECPFNYGIGCLLQNVGGHQTFQPAKLARELERFGVVNIGAVGTFVVRVSISEAKLRDEILRRLPFETGADDLSCARRARAGAPNRSVTRRSGKTQLVSVIREALRTSPPLPIEQPPGDKWEVRIVAITGRFVLSLRRPGRTRVYSNAVVEKHLGVSATTRNWNTITAIAKVLSS